MNSKELVSYWKSSCEEYPQINEVDTHNLSILLESIWYQACKSAYKQAAIDADHLEMGDYVHEDSLGALYWGIVDSDYEKVKHLDMDEFMDNRYPPEFNFKINDEDEI